MSTSATRIESARRSELNAKELELVQKSLFSMIATINDDGSPQVTPTWYMYENGKFILTTAEDNVKTHNIRRDPRVRLLIDDGYNYVAVNGKANVNRERDVQKDTERVAVRYIGRDRVRDIVQEILKVKHVILEVTPESVSSLYLKDLMN